MKIKYTQDEKLNVVAYIIMNEVEFWKSLKAWEKMTNFIEFTLNEREGCFVSFTVNTLVSHKTSSIIHYLAHGLKSHSSFILLLLLPLLR
jgi:hypothetical protein